MASELGLPATIEKRDPLSYQRERHVSSFEQAAREMRYSFLAEVALEVKAAAVAVGHTADDQAETVLEHILRGSGLPGLRAMTEVSPWPWPPNRPGIILFRPLLQVTRADTTAYCRELAQEFREDSGNSLPRFTRNRVRRQLIPLLAAEYNPRVREALVRLARTAALELDYLDQECNRIWPQAVSSPKDSSTTTLQFDRHYFASLHPALQRRLLLKGFTHLAGDARRLEESHLIAMSEIAQRPGSGHTIDLPSGFSLGTTYDSLVLSKGLDLPCPFPSLEGEFPVHLPDSPGQPTVADLGGWKVTSEMVPMDQLPSQWGTEALTAHLDPQTLGQRLYVRGRRPGDRFQPLGMVNEKKLQDFFTDSHVPRAWRDLIPLLVCGEDIAWVVGYRIAEWAKVKPRETQGGQVIQIRFQRL
jgi:tRNA(Ile)-lysidine synthase